MILLIEAYFLGIDATIVNRIVKMNPPNRIINGLYWIVVGFALITAVRFGDLAFFQMAFVIFLFLIGAALLIYQAVRGGKLSFKDAEGVIALRKLLEKIRSDKFEVRLVKELNKRRAREYTPKELQAYEADQREKLSKKVGKGYGLRLGLRKYKVYMYFVSIGSDLAVAAIFFAAFALIDFVAAFLLFIFGTFVRYVGDSISKRVGVVKEEILPEQVSQR
jgi:hypothetical protein